MKEWKKVVALLSIAVFGGWVFFYWIGWGTKLEDPEFDAALIWAQETGIQDLELIRSYPFSPITRAEAAQRYVLLAQDIGLVPGWHQQDCVFRDLGDFVPAEREKLQLACLYEFFKGTKGNFYPYEHVTKANSLVGLMRGLSPARDFELTQPYRTPYVDLAYAQGITKRPSGPYLMYLVTKYELLLQLWRVRQTK